MEEHKRSAKTLPERPSSTAQMGQIRLKSFRHRKAPNCPRLLRVRTVCPLKNLQCRRCAIVPLWCLMVRRVLYLVLSRSVVPMVRGATTVLIFRQGEGPHLPVHRRFLELLAVLASPSVQVVPENRRMTFFVGNNLSLSYR